MGRIISDGGAHVALVRQSRSVARLSVAVCQRRLRCNRVQKVLSVSSAPSTLLRRSPLPPFSPPLRIRLAPTGGQAPTRAVRCCRVHFRARPLPTTTSPIDVPESE